MVRANKTLTTPDAKPARKIEFIGNSLTCGYGNEVSVAAPPSGNPNTGFNSVNENNYSAWGAITSRTLNAEYHCTAYSGRGLYRNNSGSAVGTMPSIYTRIFPDNATPVWDVNRFVPDVVVVSLGTNDFFPESWGTPSMVDSAVFVDTYISFVNTLRGYYPNAEIICVTGNAMSDFYPVGLQALTRIKSFVNKVVSEVNIGGDSKVSYFNLTPQNPPYGEDWHPSNATHVSMSNQITPFIQTKMTW